MATISQWSSLGFVLVNTGEVYATRIVFPAICTTFAALRLYTRSHQKAQIRLDDWLNGPNRLLSLDQRLTFLAWEFSLLEVCFIRIWLL